MLLEVEQTPPIGSIVEVTLTSDLASRDGTTFTWTAEVRHLVAWSFIARAEQHGLRGIGLRFISARGKQPSGPYLH